MGSVLAFLILLVVIGVSLLLVQVAPIVVAFLIPAVVIYTAARSWGYTKGWEVKKRKVAAKRVTFSTYILFGLLLAISILAGNVIGESGSGWELAKKIALVTGIATTGGSVLLAISITPLWIGYTSGIRFCRWLEKQEGFKKPQPGNTVKLPLVASTQNKGTPLQVVYGIVGMAVFCCFIAVVPFVVVLAINWIFQLPPSDATETIRASLMGGVPSTLLAISIICHIDKPLDKEWLPACTNEIIESVADIIGAALDLVSSKT